MDRDGRLARSARRQWGVVTRAQVYAAGGDRHWILRRIRAGILEEAAPGVLRFTATQDCWLQRANAALLSVGPPTVLVGRSAAFLHGWIQRPPDPLEVAVARGSWVRDRSFPVHRLRDLSARDVTTRQGLRVTSVPRTLIDLAADPELEELFEAAVYRSPNALRWIQQRLKPALRGRNGADRLRALAEHRAVREEAPDSLLEARMKRLLKRAKLSCAHHFVIVDVSGAFICEADFAWPAERVLLQVDGRRYHSSRRAFERRAEDQQRLAAEGWRLVPVTWSDLELRPAEVLQRIRAALRITDAPRDPRRR